MGYTAGTGKMLYINYLILIKINYKQHGKHNDPPDDSELLNIVVRDGMTIFQLFPSKDKTLVVLNLRLHVIDSVGGVDLQHDRPASKRLHKYLHSATETKDKREGRLLML